MLEFLIRNRTIVCFIFFTLFCIIALSLQSTTFTMSIEGVGNMFILPFQFGYHKVQGGVHLLWAGFTELRSVRDELERTRKKLNQFETASEELSEIRRENDRLRAMLSMRPQVQFESIPARIISKDPDNWFRTIVIDRGTGDGIAVNMPVIGFNGENKAVVGKVIEVRRFVSRIQPIISGTMKLGVVFQESRYPGLLSGFTANSSLCLIDYISKSTVVKFGDLVVTSGQGGIFPAGLMVGKVAKTNIMDSNSFQRVLVQPIIDFDRIEEVYVIKKEPDKAMLELLGE